MDEQTYMTATFKGREYKLKQDPYVDGPLGEGYYVASAEAIVHEGDFDNKYEITWDMCEQNSEDDDCWNADWANPTRVYHYAKGWM